MSQSAICCRACHALLGVRRHGGRLHVAEGVRVVIDPHAASGPIVRLVCSCGTARDWAL